MSGRNFAKCLKKNTRLTKPPNLVQNVPDKFSKWCERNAKKLDLARKNGKLPYFVRDNMKTVGDIVGWEEVKYKLGKGTITISKYVNSSNNDYKKLIQIAEHFAFDVY